MPVTGFHSVIETPDSVSRVIPPTATIAMTSNATASSQNASKRAFSETADLETTDLETTGLETGGASIGRANAPDRRESQAEPPANPCVTIQRYIDSTPTMAMTILSSIRGRLDRAGVVLSALCAAHCLASILIVSALGIGGQFLLAPIIHEVGLALAMVIAAVAIGWGALRHRRATPFVTAMTGLTFMGGALAMPHGYEEAVLTIIGVGLVSAGHILNLRACRCSLSGEHACSANLDR